jgi:16S rRNA (guanine966-N2)-methyltransferase
MTGKVRIIGGAWRGRKLQVADLPGLRPSGDRSRETLFNWLGPSIQACRCLDLFAGTGVLGLEAVSRGARSAVLVERSPQALGAIDQQTGSWPGRERVELVNADALDWLRRRDDGFDLVFLDPPHGQGLQMGALQLLVEGDLIAQNGRVCVEYGKTEDWTSPRQDWLAEGFDLLKSKTFGQIAIDLYRYRGGRSS